jgi:hypothetical protein
MMHHAIKVCGLSALIGACLLMGGCATIWTEKASADSAPNGIRVYPSTVYLFVDTAKDETKVKILPDLANGYDVKPITVLAKQDFEMEISQETGNISKIKANQDTTAIIALLDRVAEIAAKGAGVPVAAEVLDGTFGLQTGIYVLKSDGTFKQVSAGP